MTETLTKVLLVACLTLLSGHGIAQEDKALQELYGKSCAVCHTAGAAGAPKTGVPSEWESRLTKGMDTLVASVQNGLNAMPPKGMCFDCSAEDYKALIEYMAKPQ